METAESSTTAQVITILDGMMSAVYFSLSAFTFGRLGETRDADVETDQVLADDALMAAITRGQADVEAGRVSSWEDVKARLGM